MYVDDILLTESDSVGLLETKEYLRRHFVIKGMSKPKYFLGLKLHTKNISVLCSESSGRDRTFEVQTY